MNEMNALLQKLFESEVLSADTAKELKEAFTKQIDEAKSNARSETEAQVRVELTEKWVTERDALVEAVDTKINEMLAQEISELKEDIERFRDLETEYAQKLVESKKIMAEEVAEDMTELVNHIDAFLDVRLAAEVEELKEDIEEVKKIKFGHKMFESFVAEYRDHFINEDGIEAELTEARKALAVAKDELDDERKEKDGMKRKSKMKELLEPLDGKKKEVMETILANFSTDRLDEGYKTFLPKIMKEDVEGSSEKENKVLAEDSSRTDKKASRLAEAVTVSGDTEQLDEAKVPKMKKLPSVNLEHLKRLAGIKKK